MLTRKQHELLLYIDRHLKQTGFSPSFDEMKDALGLRSKSGIHRLISALEERGFVRRKHHRARALEVVQIPQIEAADTAMRGADAFSPTVIKGDFTPILPAVQVAATVDAVRVPFLGRIAAGHPIEAISDTTNLIDVPAGLVGAGTYYALEVCGDSMIEAGILDGDTVIVRQDRNPENGEIVVALIEGHEVTLKRLRRKGSTIALEPANARYETRIIPADKVAIQGSLAGLIRRY
ncbi:transcriptional repressor LexA [Gluconacetobacter entanii]|uniref:LexA repressor n=1 Tax=Gluconacetobacter entanii TaxID=108528 RepID=A0A318PUQ3_9PROT|nr:transcriptional repressor LexA [Gluconacetobacter entanii]MCE2577633.1 transcriptional repressor LexA [Komagataeibacter sp. FNDCR1]MBY4641197.1 transcriptional repressor LexA [Gluconacetobacter entanii]MCW4581051.1 transcriptional repressor LexA [Gluconacetobacter entanii]MCW4584280.1 transcriptional repressor LexA [Gluconacetobacter entanii]MCW4587694.1 transcriptional repressor LexA [Gluconacetobacter entanii]